MGSPTTVIDSAGLGVNVYQAPAQLHDYRIDGTGDSAVLFQPKADGSTLQRFYITRACALPGPGYTRHAFYVDCRNVTLEDVWAEVTPGPAVGQVMSVRMGGFTASRIHGEGAPHLFAYFEQDDQPGDVLVEDVSGSFTADTAIWLDSSITGRHFTFRNWDVTGNGPLVKTGPNFLGTYEVV